MSEFLRKVEARKPVIEDMLYDLTSGLIKNTKFPYSMVVHRAARRIANTPKHYEFSTDVALVTDKYPHLGVASLFPEEYQLQIKDLASSVGFMAIHDGFNSSSYPTIVYRNLLRVDDQKVSPIGYGTEIWPEDYASRMTDAMHLGLEYTVVDQSEVK